MTLYEISKDFEELDELLNTGEELTLDEQKILVEFLNENDENFDKKLEGYVKYMRSLEADQEALKNEIDHLSKRKKVIENKHDNLKNQLKYFMQKLDIKKRKAGIFEVSIRKNQPALKIIGGIPDSYMIPQPDKPDNAKIKDDLKNGIELPFATLECSESVIIK